MSRDPFDGIVLDERFVAAATIREPALPTLHDLQLRVVHSEPPRPRLRAVAVQLIAVLACVGLALALGSRLAPGRSATPDHRPGRGDVQLRSVQPAAPGMPDLRPQFPLIAPDLAPGVPDLSPFGAGVAPGAF